MNTKKNINYFTDKKTSKIFRLLGQLAQKLSGQIINFQAH